MEDAVSTRGHVYRSIGYRMGSGYGLITSYKGGMGGAGHRGLRARHGDSWLEVRLRGLPFPTQHPPAVKPVVQLQETQPGTALLQT